MNDKVIQILNELYAEINSTYGYVKEEGDNYGEPAINSGPCTIENANGLLREWLPRDSSMRVCHSEKLIIVLNG